MKQLFLILTLSLSFLGLSQADAIDRIADKYEGKEGVTSVSVTKSMFELFSEIETEGEDQEFMKILKNLNEIRILTVENDKDLVFYKEVSSSISTSGYQKLMEVNDGGEKVKFYVIKKDSKITKFLLLVGSIDESVVIFIDGLIDMKQISKLAKGLNLDGLEKNMDKVNTNK